MPGPLAETLQDSFTTLSGCWTLDNGNTGQPVESGDTATSNSPGLAFHVELGPSWSKVRLVAVDTFDLRDSVSAFRMDSLPTAAVAVGDPGSTILEFRADVIATINAVIYFESPDVFFFGDSFGVGAGPLSISPVPLYWRFRYNTGTGRLYWETSLDGSSWATQHSLVLGSVGFGDSRLSIFVQAVVDVADVTVLDYNGGGTPDCPSAPAPPGVGSGFAFTAVY